MSDKNPWIPESGLDYVGVVEDATFATDNEYRDGDVPRLELTVRNKANGNERVEKWGTGPGWAVQDDGKSVQHYEGKATFNSQTDMGKLLRSANEAGLLDELAKRGNPTDAGVWIGLELAWVQVPYTFKSQDTGEDVEYTRTMLDPDQPDTGGSTGATGADADGAVEGKLQALWDECKPDHTKFKEQAMLTIPAVLKDPEIEKRVEDPANWT